MKIKQNTTKNKVYYTVLTISYYILLYLTISYYTTLLFFVKCSASCLVLELRQSCPNDGSALREYAELHHEDIRLSDEIKRIKSGIAKFEQAKSGNNPGTVYTARGPL